MKLFVTGATGFIGREVCRTAIARGHEVLGLCLEDGATLPAGCEPVAGALSAIPWSAIERFGPDAVLHSAWIATPGVYLEAPENEVLVRESQALFDGLIARGVKQVAGVGTCIEYAPSPQPLNEDRSPLAPAYPYSRAKVQLFEWLRAQSAGRAIDWSWFRLFYPYGAGEHARRLPSDLIRSLRERKAVSLKTPYSVKDYIYISDVAEAMCRAIEARLTGPINVGCGAGVSIRDLAETVAGLLGCDPGLVRPAEVLGVDPFPHTVADAAKIRSTGWSPSVSLSDGLRRLAASLA